MKLGKRLVDTILFEIADQINMAFCENEIGMLFRRKVFLQAEYSIARPRAGVTLDQVIMVYHAVKVDQSWKMGGNRGQKVPPVQIFRGDAQVLHSSKLSPVHTFETVLKLGLVVDWILKGGLKSLRIETEYIHRTIKIGSSESRVAIVEDRKHDFIILESNPSRLNASP
ncbi:hypothetical protein BOTNAR_0149g00050 [Botryotinia narcissicola]|uniref:Uncharacterized protein n=1 Tax=Botryotinia narcissicola TaxID=278944 RepID=A0A4Z1IKY1_9HELO|nr:hypothetical protein BOTNAR_0149g00050 [Botryotinia narcissicola]